MLSISLCQHWLQTARPREQCLSPQYSEAGTFLVMEIKLDRPLVPKRLREELVRRCVRMGCGADSSSLQGGERLVQQTPLGTLHKEGLRQSPQESGGGFGQTALDVASGVLGKHLFIPAGISCHSSQNKRQQSSTAVSVFLSGLCFPLIPMCLPLACDVQWLGQSWPPAWTALGSAAIASPEHSLIFSFPEVFSQCFTHFSAFMLVFMLFCCRAALSSWLL